MWTVLFGAVQSERQPGGFQFDFAPNRSGVDGTGRVFLHGRRFEEAPRWQFVSGCVIQYVDRAVSSSTV